MITNNGNLAKLAAAKWQKMWNGLSDAAKATIADPKYGLIFGRNEALKRIDEAGNRIANRAGAKIIDSTAPGVEKRYRRIAWSGGGGATVYDPQSNQLEMVLKPKQNGLLTKLKSRITGKDEAFRNDVFNALVKYHEGLEATNTTVANTARNRVLKEKARQALRNLGFINQSSFGDAMQKGFSKTLRKPISRTDAVRAAIELYGKDMAKNRFIGTKDGVMPVSDGVVVRNIFKKLPKIITQVGSHFDRNVLLGETQLMTNPKFLNIRDDFKKLKKYRHRSGEDQLLSDAAGYDIYSKYLDKKTLGRTRNNMHNFDIGESRLPVPAMKVKKPILW